MYGNIIKTKCYSEVNIINTSLTYLAVTITDHKPLVHLFNNAQLRMSFQIARWRWRLQEFDFTISHIKGTVNTADFLLRHPFDTKKSKTDNITEQYVNFVQGHVCPEAIHYKIFERKNKTILLY